MSDNLKVLNFTFEPIFSFCFGFIPYSFGMTPSASNCDNKYITIRQMTVLTLTNTINMHKAHFLTNLQTQGPPCIITFKRFWCSKIIKRKNTLWPLTKLENTACSNFSMKYIILHCFRANWLGAKVPLKRLYQQFNTLQAFHLQYTIMPWSCIHTCATLKSSSKPSRLRWELCRRSYLWNGKIIEKSSGRTQYAIFREVYSKFF